MNKMNYELIVNPTEDSNFPERYRAVLLLNTGLSKGYPKQMDLIDILKSAESETKAYGDGLLKLTVNKHEK